MLEEYFGIVLNEVFLPVDTMFMTAGVDVGGEPRFLAPAQLGFPAQDGLLKSIPALLEGYMPAFVGLPLFLLRMATDIDWESERECFETMSREIG